MGDVRTVVVDLEAAVLLVGVGPLEQRWERGAEADAKSKGSNEPHRGLGIKGVSWQGQCTSKGLCGV